MDEIINPVWNIFERPLVDRSIRSYEFKQYRENNVVVRNLDRYEITTKNSQSWKHLANAYLFVKANLANEGQASVSVCNNGLNDFKLARLFKIRSEEHTSELQSRFDLVCRLLLEKKKKKII